MDRRERSGELMAGLLALQEGWKADIWTALPGIIQSYDPLKRTCVIQPAIKAQVLQPDGSRAWVSLPLLLDCPVQLTGGGGCFLSFPLKQGDECLVIFASRCIDAWWQSGGVQAQAELRMHDLSDGFCIPGLRSLPNLQPDIDMTKTQLRSDDGIIGVTVNPATSTVELFSSSGAVVRVSPGRVDLIGTLYINGALYTAHKHTGVAAGTAQTGGVA